MYGKYGGLEPIDGVHPHGGHFEDRLELDEAVDDADRVHHRGAIADDAERQFGRRARRHDVGRDAALDEADGVMGAAEQRVVGQGRRP